MHPYTTILQIASQQGGVIRRDQAAEAGFTMNQIDWRVSTGEWTLVTKGGYRLIAMPGRLSLLRSAAAVLPDANVSHFSAAALHDLSGLPSETVSVTVPSKTTHAFPGVQVFRNDDLASAHLSTVRGLRVTGLPRTVVDLASMLTLRHLEFVVDDLLASGRCKVADLRLVLDSVARRGKPGVRAMRTVLDARSAADENRSQLERAGGALLSDAGFTGYRDEYPIPWASNQRFDVAFPTHRLAIEWDSIRWHTSKRSFQADRRRDRLAVEHGWRVLRFTWVDVHESPISTIETIRVVLTATQPV